MGFSRQEYWSGLSCPPPGDLPKPGIRPASLTSPALQAGPSPLVPPGKPQINYGEKKNSEQWFSQGWWGGPTEKGCEATFWSHGNMLYLVGGLAYKGISQNSLQICVFQLGLADTIHSIHTQHMYIVYIKQTRS